MYPQRNDTQTDIAIAGLHRLLVVRVHQLDELAAKYHALGRYDKSTRYVALSNEVIEAFGEFKRRMTG